MKALSVAAAFICLCLVVYSCGSVYVATKSFSIDVEGGVGATIWSPAIVMLLVYVAVLTAGIIIAGMRTLLIRYRSGLALAMVVVVAVLTSATNLVTAWFLCQRPGPELRAEIPIPRGASLAQVFESVQDLPVYARACNKSLVVYPRLTEDVLKDVRNRLDRLGRE